MATRKKAAVNPWPAKIRALKKRENITHAALAAKIGIAAQTLMNWQSGHQRPSPPAEKLLRMAFPHLK